MSKQAEQEKNKFNHLSFFLQFHRTGGGCNSISTQREKSNIINKIKKKKKLTYFVC
jgi:hypothetical protein